MACIYQKHQSAKSAPCAFGRPNRFYDHTNANFYLSPQLLIMFYLHTNGEFIQEAC